jgi:hypothetical protein
MGFSGSASAFENVDWLLHVKTISVSPDDSSGALNEADGDIAGIG